MFELRVNTKFQSKEIHKSLNSRHSTAETAEAHPGVCCVFAAGPGGTGTAVCLPAQYRIGHGVTPKVPGRRSALSEAPGVPKTGQLMSNLDESPRADVSLNYSLFMLELAVIGVSFDS